MHMCYDYTSALYFSAFAISVYLFNYTTFDRFVDRFCLLNNACKADADTYCRDANNITILPKSLINSIPLSSNLH